MNISSLRSLYVKRKAWGLLASIDLAGCDHNLIQSPQAIRQFSRQLIKKVKMEPHGPLRLEKFAEGHLEGYSAVQFIKTSSLTLHFDDKLSDRAFIDLFSCKFFNPEIVEDFSKRFFKARRCRKKVIMRY